jgi:hypothetical protein
MTPPQASNLWGQSSKEISFYPVAPHVPNYAPYPEAMSASIPKWWRDQELYKDNDPRPTGGKANLTLKKCPAVFDALSVGYLLRVPVDIAIDTTGDKIRWQLPKGNVSWKVISLHDREQAKALEFNRHQYCDDVFRIHPLWGYLTPPGYSVAVMQPAYQLDVPWRLLPAVMDTDRYAPDGAYSLLLERGFVGVIKQGTPLAQIIPFPREPWRSRVVEEYDEDLIDGQARRIRSVFTGGYRKEYWRKKDYS